LNELVKKYEAPNFLIASKPLFLATYDYIKLYIIQITFRQSIDHLDQHQSVCKIFFMAAFLEKTFVESINSFHSHVKYMSNHLSNWPLLLISHLSTSKQDPPAQDFSCGKLTNLEFFSLMYLINSQLGRLASVDQQYYLWKI